MKSRHINFYPDEWLAGTVGLSLEEEGLYIRICALIYSQGGPIRPALLLGRGQHRKTLERLLQKLLEKQKVSENFDGKINQKRCIIELKNADKSRINSGYSADKSPINPEYSADKSRINSGYSADTNKKPNRINELGSALASRARVPPRVPADIYNPINITSDSESDERKEDITPPKSARADLPPPLLGGAPHDCSKEATPDGRAKRAQQLAADWQPDLTDREYAAKRGWDAESIAEQADAFRDHHVSKGTRFLDWHAGWRTWVRHAERFAARDAQRGNGAYRVAKSESVLDAMHSVLNRRTMD
jgi:uncharacterized protein YdaU (DUF1376 family)